MIPTLKINPSVGAYISGNTGLSCGGKTNGENLLCLLSVKFSKFTKALPNLILTDLIMPVMGGIDFLKYLRSRSDLEHIPCVVISGDRKDRDEALDNGADEFLVKPFRAQELQEVLDRFLE